MDVGRSRRRQLFQHNHRFGWLPSLEKRFGEVHYKPRVSFEEFSTFLEVRDGSGEVAVGKRDFGQA